MERCVHRHLRYCHRGCRRLRPRRRSCERAERFAHRHYNYAAEPRAHCARHRRRPNFRPDCRRPRSFGEEPKELVAHHRPSYRGARRLRSCGAPRAR